MNNLLSIDYGERYMGFAVRTIKTQIPIPIEVVDIKKDNIGNKISIYVDSYDINKYTNQLVDKIKFNLLIYNTFPSYSISSKNIF